MMKQLSDTVLMIEPVAFGYNFEAAKSNSFQNQPEDENQVQSRALAEFREFIRLLRETGVSVVVKRDNKSNPCPDSIFPNNWFSTHRTGELILYPMAVKNRRPERRIDIIDDIRLLGNYTIKDLSSYENPDQNKFLEGTGSMVFDHGNKIVYAAVSERTHPELVSIVAELIGYKPVTFRAFGKEGEPIYHTNVMLCIGDSFAVVGLDTIAVDDRAMVEQHLKNSGKEIIRMTNDQIYNSFAGNMLQLQNDKNETVIVMSQNAYNSLTDYQLKIFGEHNDHMVIPVIDTIEFVGGGSARCMLAEIFLP